MDNNQQQSTKEKDQEESNQTYFDPQTEQLCQQISQKQDYYSILQLDRNCQLSDIKAKFKKLALLTHPDKNKCPSASIAFQKISQAFNVLTNPDKRLKYDTYGNEEGQQHIYKQPKTYSTNYANAYYAFYGEQAAQFFQNIKIQKTQQNHSKQQSKPQSKQQPQQSEDDSNDIKNRLYKHYLRKKKEQKKKTKQVQMDYVSPVQIIGLLMLVMVILFYVMQIQSSKLPYSLGENGVFTQMRQTQKGVSYYVKQDFETTAQQMKEIERAVEIDFSKVLMIQCEKQVYMKNQLLIQTS